MIVLLYYDYDLKLMHNIIIIFLIKGSLRNVIRKKMCK